MISLKSIPDRIIQGDTAKILLDIQGQLNLKMYKGSYFNLTMKKIGGTLGNVTMYPLRFNGFPLEWEINSNTYGPLGEYGTFIVNCTLQDGPGIITTTFIVEQKCIEKKVNICNNLINYEEQIKLKNLHVKKQEIPIDYTGGCSIEKKNFHPINSDSFANNYKKEQIVKKMNEQYKLEQEKLSFNSNLISNAKIQMNSRNVNGIK